MQITNAPLSSPGTVARGDFKAALSVAALLQRVDGQPQTIGAAQYRQLVLQLGDLLDALPPGGRLQQLLAHFPAAALVYENRQYAVAGLCRSPLEQSTRSEQWARAVLAKARGPQT